MSSRKNVLLPYTALNGVDMASSHTSAAINIQYLDNVGIELVWSGASPTGTIAIQVSLDNTTYITIPSVSVSPGGSAGNAYIDLNQLSAAWVRIAYTTTGGSVGTLTATVGAKML